LNLPAKQVNILLGIRKELLAHELPSAADLDAVAEERRIARATERPLSQQTFPQKHAKSHGPRYQRFRSQELQRIARCK
jgi:hypothetical protein